MKWHPPSNARRPALAGDVIAFVETDEAGVWDMVAFDDLQPGDVFRAVPGVNAHVALSPMMSENPDRDEAIRRVDHVCRRAPLARWIEPDEAGPKGQSRGTVDLIPEGSYE